MHISTPKIILMLTLITGVSLIIWDHALVMMSTPEAMHQPKSYTKTTTHPLSDAAKEQIDIVTSYDRSNKAYAGTGAPPNDTGVCTDVVWRAMSTLGIDLRGEMIRDQRALPAIYSRDFGANISYRRVRDIDIYLQRHMISLSLDLIPGNPMSTQEWRAGDIVTFSKNTAGLHHIGIISEYRRSDGVPYMIDNHGFGTQIRITPLEWETEIIGHYRIKNPS